jgi:steroid 5-alpha reductase family enzyme
VPFPYLFLITAGVIFGLITLLWLISLYLKNASIIDIFWGIIFIAIAWLVFALTPQGYLPRKLLLCTLVTIWGLRLGLHILIRNRGKAEDFRYATWRVENGERWWWLSFFQVFFLQGFLLWVISAPLVTAQTSGFPAILTPLDWLAAWVWMLGFVFESISDFQLMLFRGNPANQGKLLTTGLWKFTRHPNYFGEAVLWWGYYLIALAAGSGWTIFSPLLMTLLLIRISGVAMLERTMKHKSGYEEYRQKTSAFIPWFPKNNRS